MTTSTLSLAELYPFPAGTPDGLCKFEADKEIFYPFTDAELNRAAELCLFCPIRLMCYEMGTSRGEDGVWGGVYLENGKPALLPFRARALKESRRKAKLQRR